MSSSKNKYDIVFQNGRVEQSWYALAQEFPEKVEGCKNFLKDKNITKKIQQGISILRNSNFINSEIEELIRVNVNKIVKP